MSLDSTFIVCLSIGTVLGTVDGGALFLVPKPAGKTSISSNSEAFTCLNTATA